MGSLPNLPSALQNFKFDEEGFVDTSAFGRLVPAYVGSPNGFNAQGRRDLTGFYIQLRERKVFPLCPFAACAEYLDFSRLSDDMTLGEYKAFWREFDDNIIGVVNYETLMPKSKFMIAILEGVPPDEGLCAEVVYYATTNRPIIGIRSDFRPAENISAPINPAVTYFINTGPFGNKFYLGDNAYEEALDGIEKLANDMLGGRGKG